MAIMTPEASSKLPYLTGRLSLMFKYKEHSVILRIEAAIKDGLDSINMYRPRHSVKAAAVTDELVELLKVSGCEVKKMPSQNPEVCLYVVSGLSGFKNA